MLTSVFNPPCVLQPCPGAGSSKAIHPLVVPVL